MVHHAIGSIPNSGHGTRKALIIKHERRRDAEASQLSLIVVSANEGACSFYVSSASRRAAAAVEPFSDWGKGSDHIDVQGTAQ